MTTCKNDIKQQIENNRFRSAAFFIVRCSENLLLARINQKSLSCFAPLDGTQNDANKDQAEEPFKPLSFIDKVPAEQIWERYFQEKHTDTEIRKIIRRLHRKKQFKQIIAAINAAILAGQPKPWMYEVLAISMEVEKYPKKEVERVLLSMTDFGATDVPNLLGSAAYLVRLGAPEQALKLYQQVSELQNSRPEPYLLGMKLAAQLNDTQAAIWSATGVLTFYWLEDYNIQHKNALKLLADTELKLNQDSSKIQAVKQLQEFRANALKQDLRIKLEWSGAADLDLIINEPLGTQCAFSNRYTQSGGALLHDGAGPRQEECYEEYVAAYAATGYYNITVSHSTGKIVGNRAKLIVTRYAGTKKQTREVVNVVFDKAEKKYRISLHQGRRTQKTPVYKPIQESSRIKQQRTHMQLLSLRREMFHQQPWLNQSRPNTARGAVGFSPVLGNVSSGSTLTASAVISGDRRYVRISLQPRFTEITDVFTFSFVNGQ